MGSVRRAVRIANCSGAVPDPGDHMYNQAKYGPVDVITGDYLAGQSMDLPNLPAERHLRTNRPQKST